jgi:hypothetical protein
VHREVVQFALCHESQLGRLTADGKVAAGDLGGVADVELTTDLAVGVGDDVPRIGIGADQGSGAPFRRL